MLLGDPLKKRQPGIDPGDNAYYDLPASLRPGEPARHANDPEKTPLYNPEWEHPARHPVNDKYILAVTALVCQKLNEGMFYITF